MFPSPASNVKLWNRAYSKAERMLRILGSGQAANGRAPRLPSWALASANGGPSHALTGHALEDRPRLQSWPVGLNSSCESTRGRSDRRSRLSCQLSTFPPSCLGNWFRTQEDQHLVPGTVVNIAHLPGSSYQQHPRKRPKSVRKKSLYKQTPP